MPGLLAGLFGAIFAAFASVQKYGNSLYEIFPARAPLANSTEFNQINANFTIQPGLGRSAAAQGGYQFLAMIVTLIVALITGALTGFVMKMPLLDPVRERHLFDDGKYWETPDDFDEKKLCNGGDKYEEEELKTIDERKSSGVDDI